MLRFWWLAAAAPKRFFTELEPQPPQVPRAGRTAFLSLLVLSLCVTVGVARATQSDAWLPLLTAALLGAIGSFLYLWGFGSIFVQRPGELAVRAWEVSGWSWTPALFGSLSMLVPLILLPALALPLLLVGIVIWHLITLRAGLSVFLERPAVRAVTLYALYIFVFPLLLLGVLMWLTARFLG